jgi:hypothetical protein
MPRRRQWTHGTHRRAFVHHLPQSWYARRARHTPDGGRRAYGGFLHRTTLPHLGDVTIVRSKKRRHAGPQGVQRIVTTLPEASAGAIRRISAWRWGVAVTLQARNSGGPLGQMQVTKDAERVARAVALSVRASLVWVRLSGHDEGLTKKGSLCKRQERFIGAVAQAAVTRTARKWPRKFKQRKEVA